jgi:hypothetical protein
MPVPPANDLWANAVDLGSSLSGLVRGSNVGSTTESGEPVASDSGQSSPKRTVWWKWTCPAAAPAYMAFTTRGSVFDTVLGIYTGSAVNALTEIVSNDDYYRVQSQVAFAPVANTTYYIQVDGYDSTDTGDIALSWLGGAIPTPTVTTGHGTGIDSVTFTVGSPGFRGVAVVVLGGNFDPSASGHLGFFNVTPTGNWTSESTGAFGKVFVLEFDGFFVPDSHRTPTFTAVDGGGHPITPGAAHIAYAWTCIAYDFSVQWSPHRTGWGNTIGSTDPMQVIDPSLTAAALESDWMASHYVGAATLFTETVDASSNPIVLRASADAPLGHSVQDINSGPSDNFGTHDVQCLVAIASDLNITPVAGMSGIRTWTTAWQDSPYPSIDAFQSGSGLTLRAVPELDDPGHVLLQPELLGIVFPEEHYNTRHRGDYGVDSRGTSFWLAGSGNAPGIDFAEEYSFPDLTLLQRFDFSEVIGDFWGGDGAGGVVYLGGNDIKRRDSAGTVTVLDSPYTYGAFVVGQDTTNRRLIELRRTTNVSPYSYSVDAVDMSGVVTNLGAFTSTKQQSTDTVVVTPDGAIWTILGVFNVDARVCRWSVDDGFAESSVGPEGNLIPQPDNSVIVNAGSTNKKIAADLSVSTMDFDDVTARSPLVIARGLVGLIGDSIVIPGFLPQDSGSFRWMIYTLPVNNTFRSCGCVVQPDVREIFPSRSPHWSAHDGSYIYVVDPDSSRGKMLRVDYPGFTTKEILFDSNSNAELAGEDTFYSPTIDVAGRVLYWVREREHADFSRDYIIESYDLSQGLGGVTSVVYATTPGDGVIPAPIGFHPTDGLLYAHTGNEDPPNTSRLIRINPATGVRTDLYGMSGSVPLAAFEVLFWRLALTPDAVWGVYGPKLFGTVDGIYRWDLATETISFFDPGGWTGSYPHPGTGFADEGLSGLVGMADNTVITTWFQDLGGTERRGPGSFPGTTARMVYIFQMDASMQRAVVRCHDLSTFGDLFGILDAEAPGWEYAIYSDSSTVWRTPCGGLEGWSLNRFIIS